MRNRIALLAGVALSLSACEQRTAPAERPTQAAAKPTAPSILGDLSTSLAGARAAFNAQRGHARFLTLLSPT